jgi:hypothetical protein
MAARLVADELDLNLATLTAALLIIIVVVVASWRTLALDTARLCGVAIANVLLIELGRRGLVVLICDVGHGVWELIIVSNGLGLNYLKKGRALVCITTNNRDRKNKKRVVEILLW